MDKLSLKLDAKQSQTLTPRLQYAVRLLQLSALDYEQELHEVTTKNPFLEVEDTPAEPAGGPDGAAAGLNLAPEPPSESLEGAAPANDATLPGEMDGPMTEHDSWMSLPGGGRDGGSEGQGSALDTMVAEVGLRQHLRSQANMLPLSERDHALVCAVIESLDDDGYLRIDLSEVSEMAGFEPPADGCELNTALRLVQSFDPLGVGARSVPECLQLQLEKVAPELRALCATIVGEHLERLAHRDTAGMARLTGKPAAEVEAACAAVRRLDPRPGSRYGGTAVQFIKPDVVARKVRGKWQVQLNPAVVPRLRINNTYAELFQRYREAQHSELASHLQEARWAIRNVEQRFSTILAVAQAILRRQYGFFEYGPLAMKPLALRDIAEEVGVHESTVCRVTNNKYIATPGGMYELKHFFSRPMPMATGGACSPTAIRSVVQEIIAAENPATPLSDVEIAQRLARQGLTVARRTVTKYRQLLKIPPVERRRVRPAPVALAA